jgi:hypothetical protein
VPAGNTSAVGTNQMPVSPVNVVVAGRVSSDDAGGVCCVELAAGADVWADTSALNRKT